MADTSTNYVEAARVALVRLVPGLASSPMLLTLYALLALAKGTETTLEDVHDAWALWRNETKPDHPSLIPFDALSHTVQEMDRPYMEAIHAAARELGYGDPHGVPR